MQELTFIYSEGSSLPYGKFLYIADEMILIPFFAEHRVQKEADSRRLLHVREQMLQTNKYQVSFESTLRNYHLWLSCQQSP